MFGMHRARSPKNIADEFEWIKNNLPQVKEILVDDDTFTMNPGHAREVSRELISRKNKLQWTCEVRSTLDKETLSLMKSAGCRLVVVGFESMDSNVLRNIKKGTVPSQTNNFVDACNQVGIKIHACFMAGNPGDSLAILNSTLDCLVKILILHNSSSQLYPGTQAYLDAASAGQLKPKSYREWISEDGLHSMTLSNNDTGLSSKDIEAFCDLARRKFYLRKRYIFKKSLQLFYDPVEFYKNVKVSLIYASIFLLMLIGSHAYCSLASLRYLPTVTAAKSLQSTTPLAAIYILVVDVSPIDLTNLQSLLPGVNFLTLNDVRPTLNFTNNIYNDLEFCCSLKPFLIMFSRHNSDYAIYFDSDSYFVQSPEKFFPSLPDSQIYLSPI